MSSNYVKLYIIAPHGAGRIKSRSKAKESISLKKIVKIIKPIYNLKASE